MYKELIIVIVVIALIIGLDIVTNNYTKNSVSIEFIEKYFQKGQRALVTGRWQTGHYENKDKETVYTNDCMVSNIEFADSKKSEDEDRNDRRRR